jgi:hypothetical protein
VRSKKACNNFKTSFPFPNMVEEWMLIVFGQYILYTQPISSTFPPDYEKRQPWNDVIGKQHYTPIGSSFKLNRPANPHSDSSEHAAHCNTDSVAS